MALTQDLLTAYVTSREDRLYQLSAHQRGVELGSLLDLAPEGRCSLNNIDAWSGLGYCLFDLDSCPMTGCGQDPNQYIGRRCRDRELPAISC